MYLDGVVIETEVMYRPRNKLIKAKSRGYLVYPSDMTYREAIPWN